MKVPNKIQHFVWRLVRDKLPIGKNLRRRNVEVVMTVMRVVPTVIIVVIAAKVVIMMYGHNALIGCDIGAWVSILIA